MDSTSTSEPGPATGVVARLQEATADLLAADPITRPRRATAWLSLVPALLRRPDGVEALAGSAATFAAAGGFAGTPWDDPPRLRPRLWSGSFDAEEPYPSWEATSTLRLLAIALGDAVDERIDAAAARRTLERVLALNLDKLLPGGSEANRAQRAKHHDAAATVLRHVLARLPRADFLQDVAAEVDAIMAQRPVWTHHVRETLRLVSTAPGADELGHPVLDRYVEAVLGPTPASMRFRDATEYAAALRDGALDGNGNGNGNGDGKGNGNGGANGELDLDAECDTMAASLRSTGLACPQHAALLLHVVDDPPRLARALGLDDRGTAVLHAHADRVAELVRRTVAPSTAQTAHGLARLLERGLLDRPEVVTGLDGLAALDVDEELASTLLASAEAGDDVDAAGLLLGGAVRVLGQPLGVGQGNNPTCQSARGISLWARHRPGQLLDLLRQAVREGGLTFDFEGNLLDSKVLGGGLAPTLHPDLDPVSVVLVPPMDRIYDAMMRLVAGRGEDGHKWVNPALYGKLVPPGYTSCFDPITWRVHGHEAMVRRLYATFHPEYDGDHPPLYDTPAGITVTDDRGRLLGLHAVSITRAARADDGVRLYFYNPNNEGRQDWGEGVVPSVAGHGEEEGESSLPFADLAARVYAFHHGLPVPGDEASVPADAVEAVTAAAKRTWGRSYSWS